MPQDGGMQDTDVFERPAMSELRKIAADINFGKVLKWDNVEDALDQFHALVARPPLHSVVIQFSPAVAQKLYDLTNTRNRPLLPSHGDKIGLQLREDAYEVTGDTLKWSKTGVMLDGQHRLEGCRKSKLPLTTHVVFGLPDEIFDVIDQGKKRSPGDVLALLGVKDHNIVAGSVRQAKMYLEGAKGNDRFKLTARKIKDLATGSMKDVQEYTAPARLVSQAFKHPPSMITALLYMIGQHSRLAAKNFAHEWVHGARVGRNENFDVLNGRLMAVSRQGGGHINRQVRAAMIIQTFNHWYSDVVAAPRALTWRKEWDFPKLEFNKAAFIKRRAQASEADTSLQAQKMRMLAALVNKEANKDGNVEVYIPEFSKLAGVHERQVNSVLTALEDDELLHCSRRAGKLGPALWRVKDGAAKKLRNGAAA